MSQHWASPKVICVCYYWDDEVLRSNPTPTVHISVSLTIQFVIICLLVGQTGIEASLRQNLKIAFWRVSENHTSHWSVESFVYLLPVQNPYWQYYPLF